MNEFITSKSDAKAFVVEGDHGNQILVISKVDEESVKLKFYGDLNYQIIVNYNELKSKLWNLCFEKTIPAIADLKDSNTLDDGYSEMVLILRRNSKGSLNISIYTVYKEDLNHVNNHMELTTDRGRDIYNALLWFEHK